MSSWFVLLSLATLALTQDSYRCQFNLTSSNLQNNCGFPEFPDQMASYASGIIQFAQTRRIEAGVSLRLKLNPSTIASIQAEILTCGDNVMPDTDTGHPVLFHASFDNVADGSGGTKLAGSSSHELQVLSDANKFKEGEASVVAQDCSMPPPTATWAGVSSFRHPVLNNGSDCLTITVVVEPQSLTLFHSRDPAGSRVTARFDTLFDVVARSSCCSVPQDMSCPSRSIDEPYWLSFNQVILVAANNDPARLHRQSNRGKRVDLTIATIPSTLAPMSSNAIGTDASGSPDDGGVAPWVIAVIVVAVLLVLGALLVAAWIVYSRKNKGRHVNLEEDSQNERARNNIGGYSQVSTARPMGTTMGEPDSMMAAGAVSDAPPSTISNPETVQLARHGSQPEMSGYSAAEHEQMRRSGLAESAKIYDAMPLDSEKPAY